MSAEYSYLEGAQNLYQASHTVDQAREHMYLREAHNKFNDARGKCPAFKQADV
jgi:hypothetical protein